MYIKIYNLWFILKGRIHTNLSMDSVLNKPTTHSHAPDLNKISVIKLQNDIKAHAAISEEPTSNILHSSLRSFPLHSAGSLPKSDSLIRSIRRQRQMEPLNEDSRIPTEFKKTDRGEDFILYEDEKLIVFTTKSNLSVLKNCKHWFADGTFKVRKNKTHLLFYIICNYFRYVQMISISCLHCMAYLCLILFHLFMLY